MLQIPSLLWREEGHHCKKRKTDKVGPDTKNVIFGRTQCPTARENGRAPRPFGPYPVVINFSSEHAVVKEPKKLRAEAWSLSWGRYRLRSKGAGPDCKLQSLVKTLS